MKHKSETEARETWWREWREADYTWSGLKRKRLNGWSARRNGQLVRTEDAPANARPATLQDLWRSEESRLVVDDSEQSWTAVHAPPFDRSGNALKSQWSATELASINTAIEDAVARLPAGSLSPPPVLPPGKRPSLRMGSFAREWGLVVNGAVFSRIPPALKLHPVIKGHQVAFIGEPSISGACPSLSLRHVLFERPVAFHQAAAEDIRISRAVFLRDFAINDGRALRTSLMGAQFFGNVDVMNTRSDNHALLGRSVLRGDLTVRGVKMGRLSLRGVKIDGELTLDDLEVPTLAISDGMIGGRLAVDGLFVGELDLDRLRVDGAAAFRDVKIEEGLKANSAVFARSLTLNDLQTGRLDMSDAVFSDRAEFRGAQIAVGLSFARAHFMKAAYFSKASFGDGEDALLDAFQETRFDSFVDFRGAGLIDFAAFDGANFKADVRFDNAVFDRDKGFEAAMKAATGGNRLTNLEHGLRALKQAAEAVRDRNGEQTFYRYELMARRQRADVGADERILSKIYSLTSRYGSSFTRPVVAALMTWLMFTVVYLVLGALSNADSLDHWAWWDGPIHPAVLDAMNISARSMLNLFGVWNIRPPESLQDAGLELELLHRLQWTGLATRCISSCQSFLSAILLFLTVLAARRRFQIS